MRRGIRLLVPALVLTAGVTACSDDPRAGTLPTPPPVTTAPTSNVPSPTASSVREALKDAVVAYYRTLEAAAATPAKADDLKELVSPDCACRQVVELLQRLEQQKHRLLFTIEVSAVRVARSGSRDGTVFLTVAQSAGREVDADGAVVRMLPATRGEYAVDVIRADDKWLLHRITKTS